MLYLSHDDRVTGLPHNWWAVDTETTNFPEEEYRCTRKTRVTPVAVGRLVLGSVAGRGQKGVFRPDELCRHVRDTLTQGGTLIFHNAAYDINVLINHDPSLKPLIVKALRENRIKDTRILEVLIRIAIGREDQQLHKGTSLQALARRYAGLDLKKDDDVRLRFGEYEFSGEWPKEFLEYAAEDALATYLVYSVQQKKAQELAKQPCVYKTLPGAEEKFGVLAERNHVMGDIGLWWFQTCPVRVDLPAVQRAHDAVESEAIKLQHLMTEWEDEIPVKRKRKAGDVIVMKSTSWGRYDKKGNFKLSHKVLRLALARFAKAKDITPALTDTGEVTMERDFWSEHIPRLTDDLKTAARAGDLTGKLSVWMAYTRLRLLQSRYLDPLAASERHYPRYFSIGARTSRTSANKFPIQQVPKHKDSIRGLFIPEDGYVFIEADYKAAELSALAQVYHLLFGGSTLGDAINSGVDTHIDKAQRIWDDFDDLDDDRKKELRQAAKAVNFGVPGGMGAAKFALFARGYGFRFSTEEARLLRQRALSADPELRRYLQDSGSAEERVKTAARNLGLPWRHLVSVLRAWRDEAEDQVHWRAALKRLIRWSRDPKGADFDIPTRPGFSPKWDLWRSASREPCGTLRGRASYTEAHNMPFQGAVANAGKIAVFNLWAHWHPENLWRPVAFVHDSILAQVRNKPEEVEALKVILHSSMLAAIQEVCPNVPGAQVDVEELNDRWGVFSGIFAGVSSS